MTEEQRLRELRRERDRAAKEHPEHNRRSLAVGLQDLRRRKKRRRAAERNRQIMRAAARGRQR